MDTETSHPDARSAPVVLVILDGWGIGRDEPGNAVLAADTPTMDRLLATYPAATLRCSGIDVGLPPGQMGNSEVGHLNLGAGFIVYQWITRIDQAITDGTLAGHPGLLTMLDALAARGGTLHLMGLVSDGGVHSHQRHLDALLAIARARGLSRIAVHAFTDGRDTSPTDGARFIAALEASLSAAGAGQIATVSGRYYAMDRDRRWERTARAFAAIARGEGPTAISASECVAAAYAAGTTDEFIVPTVILPPGGAPLPIRPGDGVICFNFRADRMRQIAAALTLADFDGFDRGDWRPAVEVMTMTRYDDHLPGPVIFPPQDVVNPVARVIAEAGLRQFHAAETEKYAHVTYFFNGGREEPFPGEERSLVPSPRVATYDLQPEMNAPAVTDRVVDAIASGTYAFVIVNFANCDMVGHTGVFAAAVAAVEAVDVCLDRVVAATLAAGGVAIVTADHGNAEEMIDRETGGPMTAHTTNPVPLVIVSPEGHPLRQAIVRQDGVLAAIAPTILRLLGLERPAEMSEAPLV